MTVLKTMTNCADKNYNGHISGFTCYDEQNSCLSFFNLMITINYDSDSRKYERWDTFIYKHNHSP